MDRCADVVVERWLIVRKVAEAMNSFANSKDALAKIGRELSKDFLDKTLDWGRCGTIQRRIKNIYDDELA